MEQRGGEKEKKWQLICELVLNAPDARKQAMSFGQNDLVRETHERAPCYRIKIKVSTKAYYLLKISVLLSVSQNFDAAWSCISCAREQTKVTWR